MAGCPDTSIPVLTNRVPAEQAVRFRPVRRPAGQGAATRAGFDDDLVEALLRAVAGDVDAAVPGDGVSAASGGRVLQARVAELRGTQGVKS